MILLCMVMLSCVRLCFFGLKLVGMLFCILFFDFILCWNGMLIRLFFRLQFYWWYGQVKFLWLLDFLWQKCMLWCVQMFFIMVIELFGVCVMIIECLFIIVCLKLFVLGIFVFRLMQYQWLLQNRCLSLCWWILLLVYVWNGIWLQLLFFQMGLENVRVDFFMGVFEVCNVCCFRC